MLWAKENCQTKIKWIKIMHCFQLFCKINLIYCKKCGDRNEELHQAITTINIKKSGRLTEKYVGSWIIFAL